MKRASRSGARANSWAALFVVVAALAFACVHPRGGWDVGALAQRHPQLQLHDGQRLGDIPPHFARGPEGVVLFLCRWATPASLNVSLPPEADARERALLQRALDAWQASGLGIAFETGPSRTPQIEIRFVEAPDRDAAASGSGDTIADCAIDEGAIAGPERAAIGARLVFASIHLRRGRSDALGREQALSDEELLAVALHELGHALGHAGHAAIGGSLMVAAPERSRWAARRLLAGKALAEPSLAALYAVESGTRVGALPIAPEQAGLFDFGRERARAAGWRGPYARVGDRGARLLWRGADGATVSHLDLPRWREVVRGREPFFAEPDPLTRSEFERARRLR